MAPFFILIGIGRPLLFGKHRVKKELYSPLFFPAFGIVLFLT